MSDGIKLNPGEEVLKRSDEVGYGKGLTTQNQVLVLTNQSLILQKKRLFGKVKETVRFPLSGIVVSNQQAQVKLSKKDVVTPCLDVYFQDGLESFRFTWEDEVKEWANAIQTLVTGQPGTYKTDDWLSGLVDIQNIADTFSGAAKSVKKVLGIKSTEHVSVRCPACNAFLTGVEGVSVKCPYCGSYYTF